MISRAAVISYHSSPLEEPGLGDSGGMTIYVRALARALAKRGVSTDIFTRATSASLRPATIFDGVRVVPIGAGPPQPMATEELVPYVEDFAAGVRAFSTSQRIGYDVVHSHYWQSGLAAMRLAGVWDVPLVHSHHTLGRVKNGSLAPGDPPEPQRRLDGEAEVIGTADALLASTEDEWRQLACLYGASHDRIKVLHPGVNHATFSSGDKGAARAALGVAPDDAMMLYVGRIQPLKGLELGIRAAGELAPSLDRPLRFFIVGGASGPSGEREIESLRSLVVALGLEENVLFVGPRRHAQLPDFYRSAEALVVCSYSESFGLASLEAQACGTPVIGTAVGGLSHVVRNERSGFLLDDRDPVELAGRLKTLLSDPDLLDSFSREAVASAARFSWDDTAGSLLDLYECLVEERMPEACVC